jgi:hypothetical protein
MSGSRRSTISGSRRSKISGFGGFDDGFVEGGFDGGFPVDVGSTL